MGLSNRRGEVPDTGFKTEGEVLAFLERAHVRRLDETETLFNATVSARLRAAMGLADAERCPLEPEVTGVEERGDITLEKVEGRWRVTLFAGL